MLTPGSGGTKGNNIGTNVNRPPPRQRREFGTLKGPVFTELNSTGSIYVAFTDVRDTNNAFEKVGRFHPEWRIRFLTAKEYAQKFDPTNSDLVSDYEGQVFASVFYDSTNPALDSRVVSHSFKDLLETFGDIKAFHGLPGNQGNVDEFLIEFFDTRAADNAVSTLNGTSVDVSISISTAQHSTTQHRSLRYRPPRNAFWSLNSTNQTWQSHKLLAMGLLNPKTSSLRLKCPIDGLIVVDP